MWTEKKSCSDHVFKYTHTMTSLENRVALQSQCLRILRMHRKFALILSTEFVSLVPLLPQQQSRTVFLKETWIFCSADQVLFTGTYFTTNLKTVTISLCSLLHKGRLQPKIFTNVLGTAVTFSSQVLRVMTEKVLKHSVMATFLL